MTDLLRPLTIVDVSPNADGQELYETQTGKSLLKIYPERLPYWTIHGAPVPHWSVRVARARVDWWIINRPDTSEPLFLLGHQVCAAFRITEPEWLQWYASAGHRHPMIAFPRPTDRRWWSNKINAQHARELLHDVATKHLPLRLGEK